MSGRRERFNAVFFSVIMVLSMVSMSAVAIGGAGAQVETTDSAEDLDALELNSSLDEEIEEEKEVTRDEHAKVASSLEDADGPTTVILNLEGSVVDSAQLAPELQSLSLQERAERVQEPVVTELQRLEGTEIRNQFWLGNAVSATVDLGTYDVDRIAQIDGVKSVAPNVEAQHPTPKPAEAAEPAQDHGFTFGLEQIDIPGFEAEFGEERGDGTSIAIIDNGISTPDDPHPDLDIATEAIAANGEVTTGTLGEAGSHGEHVAGTATGAADPVGDVPRYGVASDADLIKINTFEDGAALEDTIASVEFAVAEDADVASMSLGFPHEGQSIVDLQMEDLMQDADEEGTVVIGSAGNEGAGDLGGPATSPGAEFTGFSIGASTEAGGIAEFSSGDVITPNTLDFIGEDGEYPDHYPREYVKPDVAAPGQDVLSAGPLTTPIGDDEATYSVASGTSMAAPHAAGAVALVQSVTEEELTPTQIKSALAETAEKPDNDHPSVGERDIRFGTGIINVTAAAMAADDMQTIEGTVTDTDGEPIVGASVRSDAGAETSTDENGEYTIEVTDAATEVTVEAFGFTSETASVDEAGDFTLEESVDVDLIEDQPFFAEFGGSFDVVVDVRNLDELTVDLTEGTTVSEDHLDLSVAGDDAEFGEPIEFERIDADGVVVSVDINDSDELEENDVVGLEHTFVGPGGSTTDVIVGADDSASTSVETDSDTAQTADDGDTVETEDEHENLPEFPLGDVTETGNVSINDAVAIQRESLGLDPDVDPADDRLFNVDRSFEDGNESVTIDDAVLAQRISLGLADGADAEITIDAPANATIGDTIEVNATVENTGDVGILDGAEFRIASENEPLDENATEVTQVADIGAEGTDRNVQTLTFDVDTTGLDAGAYDHGVFVADANATAAIDLEEPPEEPFFSVSELTAPADATPGEEIDVSATVTNTGELEDTQDVEFRLDPDGDFENPLVSEVAAENLTLAGGENETVSTTVTAPADEGDFEHGIFTEDDNQTATLTVEEEVLQEIVVETGPTELTEEIEPARLELDNLEAPETAVLGDPIPASVEVTNTGQELSEDRGIEFFADDGETSISLPPDNLNLAPGETLEYEVAAAGVEDFYDTGDLIEHGFRTGPIDEDFAGNQFIDPVEEEVSADLRLTAEGSQFNVVDLQAPEQADPGEEIDVTATIENVGEDADTQDAVFEFDGADVADQEVSLDGATLADLDSETITFENIELPDAEDFFEHGVRTDDDAAFASIAVGVEAQQLTVVQDGDEEGAATLEVFEEQLGPQFGSPDVTDFEDITDDTIEETDVFVFHDLGAGAEDLITTVEEDATTNAVYLEQWTSSGAIAERSDAIGDPDQSITGFNNEPPVVFDIEEEHPIFDGVGAPGDTVDIHSGGDADFAWFEGASGDTLAEVGDQVETGGPSVAVDPDSDAVLVSSIATVDSSLAPIEPGDFTPEAGQILANAVEFAEEQNEEVGAIEGTVTDDFGEPVEGVTIEAEDQEGNLFFAETDEDGEYRIDELDPGFYVVNPADAPDGFTTEAVVEVNIGEVTVQDFTVTREAPTLEVTVVDQDGDPVEGADVFDADGNAFSGTTDENGEVTFDVFDPEDVGDTFAIRANADEFERSNIRFVTLEPGANDFQFTLRLFDVTLNDQATASSTIAGEEPTSAAVVAEDVAASEESAVIVTYEDEGDLVVAGLETAAAEDLNRDDVVVEVEDVGGFPGEHVAHVIPVDELSSVYEPGDTVSTTTANRVRDNDAATVFQGTVEVDDQSYEDGTDEVTVDVAALLDGVDDDTEFSVVIHDENDPIGPGIGAATGLTGEETDLDIPVEEPITSSQDVFAMLHFDDNGDVGPAIPNADADAGFVGGNVVDDGEVEVFSAEGAELNFEDQALGVDEDGNAVVLVDEIQEAEQIQQDVSDPGEDFVVLYEGDELTLDSLVDFKRIADAEDGELLLEAEGASPGTHTVEIHEDLRSSLDTDADVDADHPMIEETSADADTTAGEYVVMLEEDLTVPAGVDRQTAAQDLQSQAERSQAPVVDTIERTVGATVDQQFWITNAMLVSGEDVSPAALERVDGVEAVSENIEAEHPRPTGSAAGTDATFGTEDFHEQDRTFGLDQIDVPGFEDEFDTQGEDTRVSIIDDGLDPNHPDIDLELGVEVIDGEVVVVNEDMTRDPGSAHGEHVAGTAVGTDDPARDEVPRYSVAPDADLLKADIWPGSPTLADTIAAVEWSVQEDADVASMSLGFGQGLGENIVVPAMADTMENAHDAGTVVIGSAGNEAGGDDGGPVTSPGAEFNGFSIGASAEDETMAGFSSGNVVTPNDVILTGDDLLYPEYFPREYIKPDVAAPGADVLSTGPLGGNEYDDEPSYSFASGTSMAAPHAAGAVALIQSATDEQVEPKAIENALIETAEKPTTEFGGQNERDIRFGTGIINVTAAAMELEETTTITGNVSDADTDDELVGAKLDTDTGVVTSTRADEGYEAIVTSDVDDIELTADEFGYTAETQEVDLTEGDQTVDFNLENELAVELVQDQPQFAEFGESFNIIVDVRSLDELTIDLVEADNVDEEDLTVSVAGDEITLGETTEFEEALSADDVPVIVEVADDLQGDGEFSLEHTFEGAGEQTTVTTGPSVTTAETDPANFELANFDAPNEQPDPEEPIEYTASVEVTNTGQQTDEVELAWFLGQLGLADDNPVVELEPGETHEEVLSFGEINVFDFFGVEATMLQGFTADPVNEEANGDVTFERFDIGAGLVELQDPIGQDRGAAESAEVFDAEVSLEDQDYEDSTEEVVVETATLLDGADDDTEFVVDLHPTGEDGNIIGDEAVGQSENLTGANSDVTIELNETLEETDDFVAMLHEGPSDEPLSTPPIVQADGSELVPVVDAGTVEIIPSPVFDVDEIDGGEFSQGQDVEATIPTTPDENDLSAYDADAEYTVEVTATDDAGDEINVTDSDLFELDEIDFGPLGDTGGVIQGADDNYYAEVTIGGDQLNERGDEPADVTADLTVDADADLGEYDLTLQVVEFEENEGVADIGDSETAVFEVVEAVDSASLTSAPVGVLGA